MNHDAEIDLIVDLNTMDETGLPWAFLDEAVKPGRIQPGAVIVVGAGEVRAVARVVDVDDGIVHVLPYKGPVASHLHLLQD
jgi:hypothetical protein